MLSPDETFIREFEAGRWPLEKWHHADHIKLAYLYLRRYSFDEAAARLRDGIRAHNAAHNVPDLPTSGSGLRASIGRCPECGRPIAMSTGAATA